MALLKQHFLLFSDIVFPVFLRMSCSHGKQYTAALLLFFFCELSGHISRYSSFPSGIREDMHLEKPDLFKIRDCLCKLFLGFSRESRDHIRRDRRMLVHPAQDFHAPGKLLCRISSVHPFQHTVAATLEWQVEMRADLWQCCKCACKCFCDHTGF